jgi:hypothetical protein
MTHVLSTSHEPLIVDAVHRILFTIASSGAVPKQDEALNCSSVDTSPEANLGGASLTSLSGSYMSKSSMKKRPTPGSTSASPSPLILTPPTTNNARSAGCGNEATIVKSANVLSHNLQHIVYDPVIEAGFGGLLASECGSFASVHRSKKHAICASVSQLIGLILKN